MTRLSEWRTRQICSGICLYIFFLSETSLIKILVEDFNFWYSRIPHICWLHIILVRDLKSREASWNKTKNKRMVYNKRSVNLEENTRLIRSSDHCLRTDKLILASLSNHEDNDDKNVTHSHNKQYRNNERFARAFFNCAPFDVVLALSTSWNDLFCRWEDNVSTWRQIFNSCSYLQTSHTNLIQGKCVLILNDWE